LIFNTVALLLERAGVMRIKSSSYIPLIPTFSLWRRGSMTCVDIYALNLRGASSQPYCVATLL